MKIASRGATMAVDWEQRIDFAKLRGDRLARAQASLHDSELGAVLLGLVNGYSGMTPGNPVYLSSANAGRLADAAPSAGGAVTLIIGMSVLADTVLVAPNDAFAQSAVAALTDNTTGAAGATLAAGTGISTIAVSVPAASVLAGTIMAITPGYAYKVLSVDAYAEVAITTGAKAATITPNIAGGAITGGVIALSGTYAEGAKQAGTAVTAANTGTAAQEFTLVVSAVTTFVEGTFVFVIRIQNMDTANAVASLNAQINSALAGLRSQGILVQ